MYITQNQGCAEADTVIKSIFQSRGFKRFYPPRFDDYSLYSQNSSFFSGESIASFASPDGRLLALKPDITLSVANAIPDGGALKLYYNDEVCRLSLDGGEFQSVRQIGMEIIGGPDPFADAELVDVAAECLSELGGGWALDICHIGFVHALLGGLNLSDEVSRQVLAALHTKSPHKIPPILDNVGLQPHLGGLMEELSLLSGNLPDALPKAAALARCEGAKAAVRELEYLSFALGDTARRVNLDFSVIGDVDYYNGIILKGYVAGVPQAVLSGGRYDRLMERLGKTQRAAGFAISLSLLEERGMISGTSAVDALCVYEAGCNPSSLLAWQQAMRHAGKSAALCRQGEVWCQGRELWRADKNGITKEAE